MYQILAQGDKATLVLSGEVDLQTTAELKAEISNLSGISALDVRAESVNYIDSSGIAILLMMRQHCMASNITFTMSVISQPVFRVLEVAKLHELLPIETVKEAPSAGADNYGFESLAPDSSINGVALANKNGLDSNQRGVAPAVNDMIGSLKPGDNLKPGDFR